jgi:hypothetical protein
MTVILSNTINNKLFIQKKKIVFKIKLKRAEAAIFDNEMPNSCYPDN